MQAPITTTTGTTQMFSFTILADIFFFLMLVGLVGYLIRRQTQSIKVTDTSSMKPSLMKLMISLLLEYPDVFLEQIAVMNFGTCCWKGKSVRVRSPLRDGTIKAVME